MNERKRWPATLVQKNARPVPEAQNFGSTSENESAMSAGPCAPMSGHQSAGRAAGRSQSTGTFGHT